MRTIIIFLMIISLSACNPSGNRAAYSNTPFDPTMDDGTSLKPAGSNDSVIHKDTILHDTTAHIKDTLPLPPADTSSHTP